MIPSPLQTALRRLARSPRLTAAAVVCIAVGTAATPPPPSTPPRCCERSEGEPSEIA